PGPWRFVDEDESGLAEVGERGVDIGDPIAEMVQARTSSLEEARDGRVRSSGGEKFGTSGPRAEEDDLDTHRVDDLPRRGRLADEPLPDRDRRVEIGNGDTDVVERMSVHGRCRVWEVAAASAP